jgi:hypothetical protein
MQNGQTEVKGGQGRLLLLRIINQIRYAHLLPRCRSARIEEGFLEA